MPLVKRIFPDHFIVAQHPLYANREAPGAQAGRAYSASDDPERWAATLAQWDEWCLLQTEVWWTYEAFLRTLHEAGDDFKGRLPAFEPPPSLCQRADALGASFLSGRRPTREALDPFAAEAAAMDRPVRAFVTQRHDKPAACSSQLPVDALPLAGRPDQQQSS